MNANRYLPALETLETRDTPAGTVTGSFHNGTWTLIGDADANTVEINPTGILNQFSLGGINGTAVAGLTNPSNVKNIVIKLGGGNDRLDVNDTDDPTSLRGNLKIIDSGGANYAHVNLIEIGGNLFVQTGNSLGGDHELFVIDSRVRGHVTIKNGAGDTDTEFYRSSADAVSAIGGNVWITNQAGQDGTYFLDTHVGGSIVAKNGLPDGIDEAGSFNIYNSSNHVSRSIIGGNVSVSYQGGHVDYDDIWDTEVLGNVRFHYGSGSGNLRFDGYNVIQPVHIHGNLSVAGQGVMRVSVGLQWEQTGLIVGKNFTIQSGGALTEIDIHRLSVGGATRIITGQGSDIITINDSSLAGPTTILTGGGADGVLIETQAGVFGTQFAKALKVDLGAGNDVLELGISGDDLHRVELLSRADLRGGLDNDTLDRLNLASVFNLPVTELFETINT